VSREETQAEEITITDKFRREKAVTYLIRAVKYVMGYLPDFPIEYVPNAQGNPVEVTIRIFWKEKDYEERKMPTFVKPQLDRLEKEISRIGQVVGNPKVS